MISAFVRASAVALGVALLPAVASAQTMPVRKSTSAAFTVAEHVASPPTTSRIPAWRRIAMHHDVHARARAWATPRGTVAGGGAPQGTPAVQAAQPRPPRRRSAVGLGIGIGIGAGLGTAAWGASRYGENEGGGFCGRCFAQWSAVAVPVGAGVGAGIGLIIDRVRR